jgi:cobalt-precorrin-5B (C1)-methyltransferase
LTALGIPFVPHVTISIPNGEELAKKTLNSRLGIIGGLSILGTTGIVKPISNQAWTETINSAVDVALACKCKTLVLSTGRTSEMAAQKHLAENYNGPLQPCHNEEGRTHRKVLRKLTEEAFIMMGDHVGHALRACESKGVRNVVLAAQFAKLLKIACEHEQTHVSSSQLDLRQLQEWLVASPRTSRFLPNALQANTAREFLETTGKAKEIIALVGNRAARFAAQIAPRLRVKVLLAGYTGEVLYFR